MLTPFSFLCIASIILSPLHLSLSLSLVQRRWINAQLASELCDKFLSKEKQQQFRNRLAEDDALGLQQVTEAFQAAQWLHTRWRSSEGSALAKSGGTTRLNTPSAPSSASNLPSSALRSVAMSPDILKSPSELMAWYRHRESGGGDESSSGGTDAMSTLFP